MNDQTQLDALSRIIREVVASEDDDPRLEAKIGDDQAYEEWGRTYGAIHLLGSLREWGSEAIEVCVKYAGTYRQHPAVDDPMPGIPEHYLCNGGPDGTYKHLTDKQPGDALRKKIDRLMEAIVRSKTKGARFYMKTTNRSQTGVRGVHTASYSIVTIDLPKPVQDSADPNTPRINFRRL